MLSICNRSAHANSELRDQIYATLLDSESATQDAISISRSTPSHEDSPRQSRNVRFQENLPGIGYVTCCGLLPCSHQVFHELTDAIAKRHTFRLDVLMNQFLFPIWTSLPTSIRYLRHVEVKLRVFETAEEWSNEETSESLKSGFHQALMIIISKFLRNGPGFTDNWNAGLEMRLETLTIHLLDPLTKDPENREPRKLCVRLLHWLRVFAASGLLFPWIGLLKFRYQEVEKEWRIEDRGEASREALAARWRPYGWVL